MQKPHTPINEQERLAALKSFNILDTLPEEIFDHYTVLASQICGTPIALISLVDETRQWFKSKVGIDATETPRDVSICGHTILQDDLFEIKDALADERFINNPLITGEPKLRFYTGMPITTPEGYNLGTICVIDTQPRLLSDPQRDALKRIAKLIMSQIEQRLAKNTILQLNQTLYENANFIQTLIDNVPALIGYWDKNSECVFANATYQTIFGVDTKTVRGKHYLDVFPAHMTAQTYPYIQKALLGEKQMLQVSREMNGVPEHGVIYYNPHFDANNNILGIFALGLDVTNIKEAEKKLRLSEKALESTHEAIFITNAKHEIFYVNAGFSVLTGYSETEALGNRPNLLKSNEHHADFYLSLNQAIEKFGFWQGVIVNRHKEGALYSVLMTIDSIKNDAGMVTNYVASMIDITESQKTKDALALLNDMLKRTGKIANVGGWEYDWHTNTGTWSDQMFMLHDIEDSKTPDLESALLFLLPEYRETVKSNVEICIKEGKPWQLEVQIITAKGRHRWIKAMCERIDLNGVPIKLAGTCQDITESQKTKQALASSNDMLKRTGEIANVGGWEYEFQTQALDFTDHLYAIYELDTTQALNRESLMMMFQPEARNVMLSAAMTCINEGTPWDIELPCTTMKGRPIWIRSIGERININGIPVKLVGITQDITERKNQELENLNREINLRNTLVREVHHHIKNNIQGISGILFNAADNNRLLAEPINNAISKLNSIAVIHGLQGKNVDTLIELGELVHAITQNIEAVWQSQIKLLKPTQWLECYLAKNEAVPIALILNELITNAQKHGTKDCPINITLTQITNNNNPKEVHVSIANSGVFNGAFTQESNINQNGLKLVTSLMPKTGAYLSFLFEDNESQVTLMLKYPIINFRENIGL